MAALSPDLILARICRIAPQSADEENSDTTNPATRESLQNDTSLKRFQVSRLIILMSTA
jgi:hypothetical protein